MGIITILWEKWVELSLIHIFLLNGKDLLKEDKKGMRKIRGREVAMIFQEPMNSLNPCMRIEKQLTCLLYTSSVKSCVSKADILSTFFFCPNKIDCYRE